MVGLRGLRRPPLLLALALVALIAACGGDDEQAATTQPAPAETAPEATTPVRMGVFLGSTASSYWEAGLEGAREAAEEHGNVEVTVFGADFDARTQKNQLRDALIADRLDVWVIGGNDGNVLVPEIEEAISKGIKVACVLVPCGPDVDTNAVQIDGLTAQVGQSFPENGRFLGELVVDACGDDDQCKVFFMPGLRDVPFELSRLAGIRGVLDEHENIEIVSLQAGEYSAPVALQATQNVLQAQPDLDVVVSSGDTMILGAERAIRSVGKEEQIRLIGNGCSFDGAAAVKEGRWFACAAYVPRTEMKVAADLVIRASRGEDVSEESIDPLTLIPTGATINQDNVDEFTPEYAG